ncbi:MAG: LuxR C-terminal-related transcriptional regulator [Bacteroidota bacterium]|nr:LuxR C-terminal-related transcriptional regulator [Bacteroidota bacterium]
MSSTVNIVIAEPSGLLFSGLASVIGSSGRGFSVLRAESPEEIQRLVTIRTVTAVILNPGLVQGNVRMVHNIRTASPGTRLIALLYAFFDEGLLSQFDDRITINDPPAKIISALNNEQAETITAETDPGGAGLTDREIEVLRLLASGKSTKEIGEALHISTNTVITHRKNLSAKTGIRSVSGLAIYAVVKKYITPGSTGL